MFVFKEKYILGFYGFVRLFLILGLVFLATYLARDISEGMYSYLLGNPIFNFDFWHLPDLMIVLISGLITFFIFQKDKSINLFKTAIYINLLSMVLSLNFTLGEGEINIETSIFNVFSFVIMGLVFLYALYRMYWEKVYIDELTGIPNRRAFDEYLKKLGRKYTIAMIDIDHFKKFNDTYGHTEGDNVLRFVAKHIAAEAEGAVFRYGGEEFSVIYKGGYSKKILHILDSMRENLASKIFYLRTSEEVRKSKTKKDRRNTHADSKIVKVTISIGVAHKTPAKKEPQDVIITADKALYKAKEKGRNQVVKIQV
jgi:diguanylate cyclase (GGDEF)-like protein